MKRTDSSAYPPAASRMRSAFSVGRGLWLAFLVAIAVTASVGARGVATALAQHGASLLQDGAMLVVMRTDATDDDARAAADALAKQFPAIRVSPVSAAEATNLLSLQETWMQSLPEVHLAPMPPLIEVRTPGATAQEWNEIAAGARGAAGVDFVIANDDAREKLTQFAAAQVRLVRAGEWLVLSAVASLSGVAWWASAWRRRHRGAVRAVLMALGAGGIGVGAGIAASVALMLPWLATQLPTAAQKGGEAVGVASVEISLSLGWAEIAVPCAMAWAALLLLELFLVRPRNESREHTS